MHLKGFVPIVSLVFACSCKNQDKAGQTTITTWQYNKSAAISLTFDDGSRNQFSQALPLLNKFKLPATFFIITGEIAGSQYHGKFIGRPVDEIVRGTADSATDKNNFFERTSAVGFLGYKGTVGFHSEAGSLYEAGKTTEAYALIDSAYKKIRNHEFKRDDGAGEKDWQLTWEAVKTYASQGYEFASHTVTHPRLAVLTEPNILYELEKSKEEISRQLGEKYTFSAECPYGTEDERVMSYAYKIYPALRNRMPENYLGEIYRASSTLPGTLTKEYAQWQRGATTKTPLPLMKSWVDTVCGHQNNWLVLVFHGVDGVGWEALPHELLDEYFGYIRQHDDKAWIASFTEVTKYMRERMNATANSNHNKDIISIELTHTLDPSMYDLPLTLKTYVPRDWNQVKLRQGEKTLTVNTAVDDNGRFVIYQLSPNKGSCELSAAAN